MASSRTFFSKQFGQVLAMHDPSLPSSITFRMEDWGGFEVQQAIITDVAVTASGNYQFLHTLGGNIFVYVFGDRIGKVSISGLAFEGTCGNSFGSIFTGSKSGIERVLDYYWQQRIAGRKTPIKITIGAGTVLVGYVTNISSSVKDAASRIFQFKIDLATVLNQPRATGTAGATAPTGTTGGGSTGSTSTTGPYFPEDPSETIAEEGYGDIGTGARGIVDPIPTVME